MRNKNRVVMFRRVSTFLLALGLAGVAQATEAPVAVSPGEVSRLALVEGRCPTFSWGAISAATSYELVVYRVDEKRKETEPVLRKTIVGSASSWTPSLERCLERGGQYGWSVRAVDPQGKSRWSTPSLFQVASGPSESAVEEALAIVRRHFGSQSQGPVSELNGGGDASTSLSTAVSTGSPAEESAASLAPPGTQMSVDGNLDATSFSGDGSMLTSLDPTSLAPGTAAIDISGNALNVTGTVAVENGGTGATDAEGARANLGVPEGPHTIDTDTTCLDAGIACNFAVSDSEGGAAASGDSATGFFPDGQIEEPRIADEIARDSEVIAMIAAIDRTCPGALGSGMRYTDCGDGSIRDNNTGLYWLKDASCAELAGTDIDGAADWPTAESAAAALSNGTCGLADGSIAGDWRQPTISEFCSAWAGTGLDPCPASAAPTSLVDSSVGPPNVVDSAGSGTWTEGDPFTGVHSSNYWSSTSDSADSDFAWEALLNIAQIEAPHKNTVFFVWPVRSTGQIFPCGHAHALKAAER